MTRESFKIDGEKVDVENLKFPENEKVSFSFKGKVTTWELITVQNMQFLVNEDRSEKYCVHALPAKGEGLHVKLDDLETLVGPVLSEEELSDKQNTGNILAPIPSRVSCLKVNQGDKVDVGQPLIVLEAMKMEHVLTSHLKTTIKKVCVGEGDSVNENQILIELNEES